MYKFEIKIIWVDQSEADFVEIQITMANKRLTAIYDCYASLESLKKQWQKEVVTQALSGKKIKWEMDGSNVESIDFLIEKAEITGKLALSSRIIFEKNKEGQVIEECLIRIFLEPAQLDSFCEQIQLMESKIGETANIE